jgi:folate-binding protein YgfZ
VDDSHFPDEVGLEAAISTTKGCYVGRKVARTRTYGRVNRRLVGFRFPDGPIVAGAL